MKTTWNFLTLLAFALAITSCGSGVKDRVVANSSSASSSDDLSNSQLDALAAAEIEESLQAEGIQANYDSAKSLFTASHFSRLDDLLLIVCKDSPLPTAVNRYHDYAIVLSGLEGVIEKLDLVLSSAEDENQNYAPTKRKIILSRIIAQIQSKRSLVADKAAVCAKVKLSTVAADPVKPDPIPLPPKGP